MNQENLNNHLLSLGVTRSYDDNKLYYTVDITDKLLEVRDENTIFKNISRYVGTDTYNHVIKHKERYDADISDIVIDITPKYRQHLMDATKEWGNKKAIKNASREQGYKILFPLIAAVPFSVVLGGFIGAIAGAGYRHSIGDESDKYVLVGGIIGAGVTSLSILYHFVKTTAISVKEKNTYESRLGARKIYKSLTKGNIKADIDESLPEEKDLIEVN